jgi:hypothetical protein
VKLKIGEKVQAKRGISEVKLGYHSKRGGYTTLVLKLCAIKFEKRRSHHGIT